MPTPLSNEEMLNGLKEGQNAIIRHWYIQFLPGVKRFVLANSGTEGDADTIFQDALIQLMARIQVREFEAPQNLGGYVFVACRNLWFRELDKRKRKGVTNVEIPEQYDKDEDLAQATLELERRELFQEKFQALSDKCRELLGYLFAKIPGKEIMKRMGYASETAVRQRTFKCKAKLGGLIKADPRFSQLLYK